MEIDQLQKIQNVIKEEYLSNNQTKIEENDIDDKGNLVSMCRDIIGHKDIEYRIYRFDPKQEKLFPYFCDIKGLNKISNFELKIPGTKNKRELDLLVCDSIGNALYIEFKHFYLPESYSEKSNLDNELIKAQRKMKDQLYAIKENSEEVMHLLKLDYKINKIDGIIVSYLYTGTDVDISEEYPIISLLTVKDAIKNATSINEIYAFCQKSEKKYACIPLVKKNVIREYAKMKTVILDRCTVTKGDVDTTALEAFGEIEYFDIISKDEIIKALQGADAVICNKAVIDKEIIDETNLKFIGVFATGYNNIDIE